MEKELPPLVLIDDTNRDNFPLGLCYGDCDDDVRIVLSDHVAGFLMRLTC